MCMRPRVHGNFMNLQCKYFQNTLYVAEVFWWLHAFWSQIPKGKLQILTFSKSCLRITEIHKVTVYNQRNAHSGLEGMLKGVINPVEGVLLTYRGSAHRCFWQKEESFMLALFLHSSLGIQVWLLVETRKWATGTPNTVIFMSLFWDR